MAIEKDLTGRTVTPNYSLIEPQYNETADITDINYDMEQIDTAMAGLQTDVDKTVKFTSQSLSASQKAQARSNIGAGKVIALAYADIGGITLTAGESKTITVSPPSMPGYDCYLLDVKFNLQPAITWTFKDNQSPFDPFVTGGGQVIVRNSSEQTAIIAQSGGYTRWLCIAAS